jgi:hypothetical protein
LLYSQIYFDMAKKAKKTQTDKGLKLKIVNPNAAGIDIASGEMQVCAPPRPRRRQQPYIWKFHK